MPLTIPTTPQSTLFKTCLHLALGSSSWGYNIGILSSILIHPGFLLTMSHPSSSTRGSITGIYYLGTILSYLFFSHPLADWLGRKKACGIGTVVVMLGAGAMGMAGGVGGMMFGRWVCGLGVGVVSTTVPLYQSEISPAQERGKYVTLNHVGFIAGLATGLWIGYGMSFWTGPAGDFWGWRLSILLQLIPALLFLAGLPYIPESYSPLAHPKRTQRRSPPHPLRPLPLNHHPNPIRHPHPKLNHPLPTPPSFLSLSLSLFRDPSLRARLWRAFLLQFMAQMCGAAAMKYYLPDLFRALGVEGRLALMAGAIEMTLKIGMTVLEMWIIDRIGRRACLVGGSLIMGVAMFINAVLPLAYPSQSSPTANAICILFIFVYALGYSLGLGPAAWVYSSEIFPTGARARGLNFAASGGSIGSLLVTHIWPVGLARWGSGIYFFFTVVNFACAPIIWMCYPETKGRALEDMDDLFGKTYEQGLMLTHNGTDDDDEEHYSDYDDEEEDGRLLFSQS